MSKQAFNAMARFWIEPTIREHVVDVYESCGVLVAVATAPVMMMPATWMTQLVRAEDEDWLASPDAGEVQNIALAYWSALDDCIVQGEPLNLPPACDFDGEQASPELDAFAEGFLRAQEWLEPEWKETGERDHEPLTLVLEFAQGALVYLCGNEAVRQEMRRNHPRLPADPGKLLPLLPRVFTELGLIGRGFRDEDTAKEDAF